MNEEMTLFEWMSLNVSLKIETIRAFILTENDPKNTEP